MGRGKKKNISGEEKYNTYNIKLCYCGKGKKKTFHLYPPRFSGCGPAKTNQQEKKISALTCVPPIWMDTLCDEQLKGVVRTQAYMAS